MITSPLLEDSGYPAEAITTVTAHSSDHSSRLGAQAPGRRRPRARRAGRCEAGQHGLGLGVAEAAVELEHLRAVGGEHQPGVEHAADTGVPAPRSASTTGWWIARRRARPPLGGRCPATGRVAPHAAGVRALVAVADPLVVLGGGHRDDASRRRRAPAARAPRPRGTPRARRAARPRRSARRGRTPRSAVARPRVVGAMITPLPAASPSAFSTAG